MAEAVAKLPAQAPLKAVVISRDVEEFDLLIEDMDGTVGEDWGDLTFAEANVFLRQPEAAQMEFAVIAADDEDEPRLPGIVDVIRLARDAGLRVILVADGLGPMSLHELMRAGSDDFAPYPLPEGALEDAIERATRAPRRADVGPIDAQPVPEAAVALAPPAAVAAAGAGLPAHGGDGITTGIFALQSAAGGNGATTLAVNLAWEFANLGGTAPPRVLLVDLGLQFGSAATYLDLPRKETVFEVLSDTAAMDEQAFRQVLTPFKDRMSVFTAPAEILPLDVVGPKEIDDLLTLARAAFDVVVIDMPGTVTGWTDAVLKQADIFFLTTTLEVRSAQNALRFQRLLRAEGLDDGRLAYLLNRAPGKMDLSGRGRVDKMAESLGIAFHAVMPEGGKQVTEVNDQGQPLRALAPRNALTKEIARLAGELYEARRAISAGQDARPAPKKSFLGLSFG
jgi:pilus assembly protein CpaE